MIHRKNGLDEVTSMWSRQERPRSSRKTLITRLGKNTL